MTNSQFAKLMKLLERIARGVEAIEPRPAPPTPAPPNSVKG